VDDEGVGGVRGSSSERGDRGERGGTIVRDRCWRSRPGAVRATDDDDDVEEPELDDDEAGAARGSAGETGGASPPSDWRGGCGITESQAESMRVGTGARGSRRATSGHDMASPLDASPDEAECTGVGGGEAGLPLLPQLLTSTSPPSSPTTALSPALVECMECASRSPDRACGDDPPGPPGTSTSSTSPAARRTAAAAATWASVAAGAGVRFVRIHAARSASETERR
jgi:hypothetical protein